VSQNNIRPLRRPENALAAPGRRWKTNMPGELASPAGNVPCTVLDISSWGAQLRVDQALPPQQQQVSLILEAFGAIAAEIVWQRENAVGVQFLQQQAAIRRLHMERLDPATWPSTANQPAS
jgi:PilZ domain